MELGDLGLSYFSMTILRPYPGTEIYSNLLDRGYSPEDIFFVEPSDVSDIDKRYVYGFRNRLNGNVKISEVPIEEILKIARETIDEFNERFCTRVRL